MGLFGNILSTADLSIARRGSSLWDSHQSQTELAATTLSLIEAQIVVNFSAVCEYICVCI